MASKNNENINNEALGFTMTQKEFVQSANTFVEKSDKLYDGWVLAESNGVQFLKLVTQRKMDINSEISECNHSERNIEFAQFMESEVVPVDANKEPSNVSDIMLLEYHVIYSISYCVPVLYLRAFNSVGGALRIDKLILSGHFFNHQALAKGNHVVDEGNVQEIGEISDMPEYLSTETSFVRPDTFSQAPHPLLFEPFYQLHPCHTSEWMKMMFAVNIGEKMAHLSVENYITVWLSFVGPYVGLSLDNKYMLI